MKILSEGIGALIALAVIIWVAAIYTAPPEKKSVITCKPVHYGLTYAAKFYLAVSDKPAESLNTLTWPDEVRLGCLNSANRWYGVN